MNNPQQPVLLISACLVGRKVRYDGETRCMPAIVSACKNKFLLLPICPEAECGFGVPREASRLEGNPLAPRFITLSSRRDLTEALQDWIDKKLTYLKSSPTRIAAAIFKSKSPSCAVAPIPVFTENSVVIGTSKGLFAKAFSEQFPSVPVAEETDLTNTQKRIDFLQSVTGKK